MIAMKSSTIGYIAAALWALVIFLFGLLLASLPVAANTAVLLL